MYVFYKKQQGLEVHDASLRRVIVTSKYVVESS